MVTCVCFPSDAEAHGPSDGRGQRKEHHSFLCFLCSVNVSADLILSTGWQMNFHSPHFFDEEAGSYRFYVAFSCSVWSMELLWKVRFNPGVSDPKVGNSFRPGLSGPFLLYLPRCSAGTHRGAFPRETILPNTTRVCSVGATVAWLFLGTLFLMHPRWSGQQLNKENTPKYMLVNQRLHWGDLEGAQVRANLPVT